MVNGKPYVAEQLPLAELNWRMFIPQLGPANAAIARYDGILQAMVNPDLLLSPLTTQEAVVSSRIEGTQATLQEVFEFEAGGPGKTSKKDDIQEILNYRHALADAVETLERRPISLNLIKNIHGVLLRDVRGHDRGRGNFRSVQNWIGRSGNSITVARFVPPEPSVLPSVLDNFEKYIHHREDDRLVQLAIIHAQFELIHPFVDGNGRVGRILIPLFLFEKKLLSRPTFYLSAYLEAHRDEYYDKLQAISARGDWDNWIKFFLTAVTKQAATNTAKAKDILELYEKMKYEISRTQYAIQVLDALFTQPIFSIPGFLIRSKITRRTANRALNTLLDKKILSTIIPRSGRRPAILLFNDLFKIIDT